MPWKLLYLSILGMVFCLFYPIIIGIFRTLLHLLRY
nr:MAG TPA: Protein of unknown function (DUF2951) [Caudoviricetes sp.]